MENFIVHPGSRRGGAQKTDADLFGVRYPRRTELDMRDDKRFTQSEQLPYFLIVEVTGGKCKLNGPWTDRNKRNIDYVLKAIGAFEDEPPSEDASLETIADALYQRGGFLGKQLQIRLFAAGREIDDDLTERFPELAQITLKEMLDFIHHRFRAYQRQKANNEQWNHDGKSLYEYAQELKPDEFCQRILGPPR